jgi:hypothetical protein
MFSIAYRQAIEELTVQTYRFGIAPRAFDVVFTLVNVVTVLRMKEKYLS